jgi:poly(3-hydroxybutyrate) depolymerase
MQRCRRPLNRQGMVSAGMPSRPFEVACCSSITHTLQCTVDPQRICVSGFSDGASYALSLGLANGDLFTHVAAFSPGFMRPPCTQGGWACAPWTPLQQSA